MYPHVLYASTSDPARPDRGRMASMERHSAGVIDRREPGRLSPCVCSTLRMVSRAVTQLYDDILRPSGLRVTQFSILATVARGGETNLRHLERALAIDQTTLTRSVNLLERDRMIERVPNPDGRVKAMRLTGKGKRRLARLLHVAVVKRRLYLDRRRKLSDRRS